MGAGSFYGAQLELLSWLCHYLYNSAMVAALPSCQAHLTCEGQPARLRLEVPLQPQGGGLELAVERTSTKDGVSQ